MKLSKLYSNNRKFRKIDFRPGLNIIYGDAGGKQKEDPHNLGKSALTHLIDFMLLKEVKKNTYFYNKVDLFRDYTFYLEILLNDGSYLTIKRSFENPTRANIKRSNESENMIDSTEWDYSNLVINSQSKSIVPATAVLNNVLNFDVVNDYSYRNLLGYFIRNQSDYDDVFQLRKFTQGNDENWKPFVFELLGFNPAILIDKYSTTSTIDELKTKIASMKSYYNYKDIDKLNGQIDILTREKNELERDLDTFNFYLNEKKISESLVKEIEAEANILHQSEYNLRMDIELIERSLNAVENVDFSSILEIFEEVQIHFSDQLVKSYEELIEFNNSLRKDRKAHLSVLLKEKRVRLNEIDTQLLQVGVKRSEILSILNDEDVFEKYKKLRTVLIDKEKRIQHLYTQRQIILETREELELLNSKKRHLEELNQTIEEQIASGNETLNDIRYIFKLIFEELTGKDALINISTNKNSNVEFKAEISSKYEIQSHEDEGYTYKKILCICFDLAILQYYTTQKRSYFRFAYHDGPFDSLHDHRKKDYLEFIKAYSEQNNIQYIISMLDSDLHDIKYSEISPYIVSNLFESEDGAGTLFGFKY